MALPAVDPELELQLRVDRAKGRLRRWQAELKYLLDGLTVEGIATQVQVDRNTVLDDLRKLGVMPQPNQHPRKAYEAMPWLRGRRGAL